MQEGEEAVGRARMFVLRVLRVSVLVGSLDLYGPIPKEGVFHALRTFVRKSSNIDFFLKLSPV